MQFARNRAVEQRGLENHSFKVGVGVAGRAAWLGHEVRWALGSPRNKAADFADYYEGIRGDHHAVLAIPLFPGEHRDELPVAVLSIAAEEEGHAFTAGIVDASPEPRYPFDVHVLARRVSSLVFE